MSIQRFKVALNNANFPLISTKAQRAVFVPGLDAAPRTPRVFMGSDASADYNMTQVIYAENVMPVAEGVRSVGYLPTIPAATPATTAFNSVFPLRDANENFVLFSPASNSNFVHNPNTNTWTSLGGIAAISGHALAAGLNPVNSRVTYAYVDGRTFVCYSRLQSSAVTPVDLSIYEWQSATSTLVLATTVQNLPFAAGTIDGIASSSGNLIVWSNLTIAWAPFNGAAFNFQPFLNGAFTGAGHQIPEDIQGAITSIIGTSGGFVAFTRRNAIAANYHAETLASPWIFREIPNAGGLENYEQATVEGSAANIQAYTTAGMQSITLNSAETTHGEVADFIAARQAESYDFNTQSLTTGRVSVNLFTKLTNIGNRYLVVSYGYFPGVFSFALVYDVVLRRWGKLRILHRDCFTYVYPSGAAPLTYAALLDVQYSDTALASYAEANVTNNGITAAHNAMAFLQADGTVLLAAWSQRETVDQAVVIIGRVQLTRQRNTQLNRLEIEGLEAGTVSIQSSHDGRTIDGVHSTVTISHIDDYRVAGCLVDTKNFNVVIEGSFNLSTLILEAMPTGSI